MTSFPAESASRKRVALSAEPRNLAKTVTVE